MGLPENNVPNKQQGVNKCCSCFVCILISIIIGLLIVILQMSGALGGCTEVLNYYEPIFKYSYEISYCSDGTFCENLYSGMTNSYNENCSYDSNYKNEGYLNSYYWSFNTLVEDMHLAVL